MLAIHWDWVTLQCGCHDYSVLLASRMWWGGYELNPNFVLLSVVTTSILLCKWQILFVAPVMFSCCGKNREDVVYVLNLYAFFMHVRFILNWNKNMIWYIWWPFAINSLHRIKKANKKFYHQSLHNLSSISFSS